MTEQTVVNSFIDNENSWLNGKGPSSGIVFSSRIRLARNFQGLPFPCAASLQQKEIILSWLENAKDKIPSFNGLHFLKLNNLSSLDRKFLMERHVISYEHTLPDPGKGLLISPDEKKSIMINEEDHLRIQVMASGFNLLECWDTINIIDNEISSRFAYAFSPKIGYLASCPTNTGTGMRVSCMMHLPALVMAKKINKILDMVSKISFTARGFFGEGTQSLGDFFQISNQISLGVSEKELIENLSGLVAQITEQETDARHILLKKYSLNLEDNLARSLAILKSAKLINTQEALGHLSMLSLGLDLGIINELNFAGKDKAREMINSLFILMQPAHLQKIENKVLQDKERDYIRAQILREKLSS